MVILLLDLNLTTDKIYKIFPKIITKAIAIFIYEFRHIDTKIETFLSFENLKKLFELLNVEGI